MNDNKYKNYMITSSKYHTPPYEWSGNIFQRFQPVSGKFLIGNNFFGQDLCVNNQSGRGFYANPCGYWDSDNPQFNKGATKNMYMNGNVFPNNKNDIMIPPNNPVVFGYARIGEEFRAR